jgi:hypothetical protein
VSPMARANSRMCPASTPALATATTHVAF